MVVKVENVGCVVYIPISLDVISHYSASLIALDLAGVVNITNYITGFTVYPNAIQVTTSYNLAGFIGSQANAQVRFTRNL